MKLIRGATHVGPGVFSVPVDLEYDDGVKRRGWFAIEPEGYEQRGEDGLLLAESVLEAVEEEIRLDAPTARIVVEEA